MTAATAQQKIGVLKRLAAQRRQDSGSPASEAPSYLNQPRDAKGRWAKTGKTSAKKAKKAIAKVAAIAAQHEGTIKDGLVNAGGVLGSVVGERVAGPAGALAGDLLGALVARKAVHVATVAHSAHQKLKVDEGFARAKGLEKLKQLGAKTLSDLKSEATQERLGDDLTGDIAGWAIGNSAAKALSSAVPAIASVPLKGAGVAMLTVPKLVKLRQKLKQKYAES